MSRFEQVAQEVASDSYLREWYDKIMSILDDYPQVDLTEDKIIETVANSIITRSGDDVPIGLTCKVPCLSYPKIL